MIQNWLLLSIGAAVSFSLMTLLFRAVVEKGVSSSVALGLILTIATIAIWVYTIFTEKIAMPSNMLIIMLLIAGVASAIGNILLFKGVATAPNPGYAEAASSLRIVFITIISIFLFALKPQPIGIVGILLITGGLILLGLT